jgi:hypothetical protein
MLARRPHHRVVTAKVSNTVEVFVLLTLLGPAAVPVVSHVPLSLRRAVRALVSVAGAVTHPVCFRLLRAVLALVSFEGAVTLAVLLRLRSSSSGTLTSLCKSMQSSLRLSRIGITRSLVLFPLRIC